jgi:electron transfer flavoprotein alpha/beta subunit
VTVPARVAEGLNVPLVTLLEDESDRRVVVRRRADHARTPDDMPERFHSHT